MWIAYIQMLTMGAALTRWTVFSFFFSFFFQMVQLHALQMRVCQVFVPYVMSVFKIDFHSDGQTQFSSDLS